MASGMGPKQPAYHTILQLDQKVREFAVPATWRATSELETAQASADEQQYRWLVLSSKETGEPECHRYINSCILTCFSTTQSSQSVFCPSTAGLTQRRTSTSIPSFGGGYLPCVLEAHPRSPSCMGERSWLDLSNSFTVVASPLCRSEIVISPFNLLVLLIEICKIVMCILITKFPSSHLTPSAMENLQTLQNLFLSASQSSAAAAALLVSPMFNRLILSLI